MTLETESELVQNTALGATLLSQFVVGFFKQAHQQRGPRLPLVLPVLPMVMHQDTVDALHRRRFEGGLDLALAENRTLVIDLQERMRTMTHQTMRALNVAFAANLLTYDRRSGELIPQRLTLPFEIENEEVQKMLYTARRLGYWFCTINLQRLSLLLRIRL